MRRVERNPYPPYEPVSAKRTGSGTLNDILDLAQMYAQTSIATIGRIATSIDGPAPKPGDEPSLLSEIERASATSQASIRFIQQARLFAKGKAHSG